MNKNFYYLSSLDSAKFSLVRKCIFIKRLMFDTGKDCVLVNLAPPVIGQDFGFTNDLDMFILASRHEGNSVFNIKSFPCFVFIARLLTTIENIELIEEISRNDVEVIAWGELYRTKHDANNNVFD